MVQIWMVNIAIPRPISFQPQQNKQTSQSLVQLIFAGKKKEIVLQKSVTAKSP